MKLLPFRPPPGTPEDAAASRLKRMTIAILAVGWLSALVIFVAASTPADNPLGYEPLQTKKYLHDLELYGGKANVMATEFREWFNGLWQGRNLAYTVAVGTLLVVWIYRFFAAPLPEEVAPDPGASPDRRESHGPAPPRIVRARPKDDPGRGGPAG